MSPGAAAPGEDRQALIAGFGCYILWGLLPVLFIVMGRAGATPLEILGERAMWSAPWAGLLVLAARQGDQVRSIFARPRVLAQLALSAALIGTPYSQGASNQAAR